MNHHSIVRLCEALGLTVRPTQCYGVGRSFSATIGNAHAPRVYWSTSTELGLLGSPRVLCRDGHDTHARNLNEIRFLVNLKGK